MYETRDKRSFPKAGADGCYHSAVSERRSKKKKKTIKKSEHLFHWDECCEYCPYPDCIHRSFGVCLTEITYSELEWFVDDVVRRKDDGEGWSTVTKETGISFAALKKIMDFKTYPDKAGQKKIKEYLEKHKED